jgi:hypothetical protein
MGFPNRKPSVSTNLDAGPKRRAPFLFMALDLVTAPAGQHGHELIER